MTAIPTLPQSFWERRAYLRTVRSFAWHNLCSPDAFLHICLVRTAGVLPKTTRLHTGVGWTSLTLYTGLVGASGAGKTMAVNLGKQVVPVPKAYASEVYDLIPLGSGEGLAEAFLGYVEETVEVNGKEKTVKVKRQVKYGAIIYVDEGNVMVRFNERAGSTTAEALRSAFTGSPLGQLNARQDTKRYVEGYSIGLIVNVTPAVAGRLLNDAEGGTPQRFLWAASVDPTMPETQPNGSCLLNHFPWKPGKNLTFEPALESITRSIRYKQVSGREVPDELDAHALLVKCRVASIFGLWDGRMQATLADWDLAETVWAKSCEVREYAAELAREIMLAEEDEKGEIRARSAAQCRAALSSVDIDVERVAKRIATRVHEKGPLKRRELVQAVNSRDRHLFEAALTFADTREWVRWDGSIATPGSSQPTERKKGK